MSDQQDEKGRARDDTALHLLVGKARARMREDGVEEQPFDWEQAVRQERAQWWRERSERALARPGASWYACGVVTRAAFEDALGLAAAGLSVESTERTDAVTGRLLSYASSDNRLQVTLAVVRPGEIHITFATDAEELAGALVRFALVRFGTREVEVADEVELTGGDQKPRWQWTWTRALLLRDDCELICEVVPSRPAAKE